jgi:hypothetical protein
MRFHSILVIFATLTSSATAAEDSAKLQKQFDERRQAIYDLQQQLIPLLRRGEGDSAARKQVAELENRIAAQSAELATLGEKLNAAEPEDRASQPPTRDAVGRLRSPENNALASEPQKADEQEAALAYLKQQLANTQEELARTRISQTRLEQLQTQKLPPIENGEIKVFALRNAKAADAAATVSSLFGAQAIRVAVDDRSNTLIALGKAEVITPVEALLQRIDQQASPGGEGGAPATPSGMTSQSLLLRIFWLADGLPEGEGQDPEDFLPKAVLKAAERLGLHEPRLVTQTVNSLAVSGDREVQFTTNVPAMVLKQPTTLSCTGRMRPVVADRAGVDVQIQVMSQAINCQLSGSLATPLGHYMVLGTANSIVADPSTVGGLGMMQTLPGVGRMFNPAAGRGGEGGYGGEGAMMGRGGFAGPAGVAPTPGAAIDPATGAPTEGAQTQPAEPKYNTSRFAFVVQVIEGESYAAEK